MFEVSPQGLGHSILRNFVSRVSTVEFVPPFPKPSSRDMNVCLCGSAGDHCGVVLCKTPEAHILFRGAEKVCVCVCRVEQVLMLCAKTRHAPQRNPK